MLTSAVIREATNAASSQPWSGPEIDQPVFGLCRMDLEFAATFDTPGISQLLLQGDQGLPSYLQCRRGLAQGVPRFVRSRDCRKASLKQIVFD